MHSKLPLMLWLGVLFLSCTSTPDGPAPTFEARWTVTVQGFTTQHSRREFSAIGGATIHIQSCTRDYLLVGAPTGPLYGFLLSIDLAPTNPLSSVPVLLTQGPPSCPGPYTCNFISPQNQTCSFRPATIGRRGDTLTLELVAPCRLHRRADTDVPSFIEGDYVDLHQFRLQVILMEHDVDHGDGGTGARDCGAI